MALQWALQLYAQNVVQSVLHLKSYLPKERIVPCVFSYEHGQYSMPTLQL